MVVAQLRRDGIGGEGQQRDDAISQTGLRSPFDARLSMAAIYLLP